MERQLSWNRVGLWVKKSGVAACVLLLAFVFSLQCSVQIWSVDVPLTDAAVFQYVARVILDGGMPYKDAFDHKGPLLYLLNAAGLQISQWRGIWLIELITLFISFALIYKIARLKCSSLCSMAVLLCSVVPLFSYFQRGNLTEEYAIPFIAAAIYIFADYFLNDRIDRVRLIVCGLSFAAVFLLRVNMVSVWAAMCVAVLLQCCMTRQFRRIISFLQYFLLGFALLAVPVLLWLAVNGAFSSFIEDYFLFNMIYSASTERSFQEMFFLFLNEKFTLTAFAISVFLAAKKRDIFHCFYVIAILASLAVVAMPGRNYPHYGMILIPMLAYPFACFVSMLEQENRIKRGAVLLIMLFVLSRHVLPVWISSINQGIQAYHMQEDSYIGSREGKTRNIIRNYTQEDDQIIVCGNWNSLYNLSERFAASRYSYQMPVGQLSPQIMEEFYSELESNLPKLIIIQHEYFDRERIMEFIDRHGYQWVWQSDDRYAQIYSLDGM